MTATSSELSDASRPDSTTERPSRGRLLVAGLGVALPVVLLVSSAVGPVGVPVGTTARILWAHLLPGEHVADWTAAQDQIVWAFRMPRTLLAALVGASLALAGMVLQAVIRNPLADPYVLGASSGASMGAVGALVAGATVPSLLVSGSAFGGAAAAAALVFVLAQRAGQVAPLRLVLVGVALSYLFSAATSWITVTADHGKLPGLVFFLLGSVSSATWAMLAIPLVVLLAALTHAALRVDHLNAVMTGDESATSLGVDVSRFRIEALVATSLLTGAVVAVSGGIGFVGMVVPHVCRLVVGADHRRLVPATVLGGAVFLVVVDMIARTAAAPQELPIGIVTSALGAPFFLWLLRGHRRRR
ncbi:FecCD family ABC transporter permease [Actinopolymorpha alba]|uniref:FecCD family ABC transporter permease n=1 Tax=Actinopolymorpha alba TaxID=533267 RepID=UPI0003760C0A|nr:iron ABC transporter permease [Actinopolymorpha alba]